MEEAQWRSGKIGLVVVGHDGSRYAITCRHLTSVSNGTLYTETPQGQKMEIGVVKTKEGESRHDIDCFKINDDLYSNLRENQKKFEQCSIFDGQLDELYDKEVFRHVGTGENPGTRKFGRVASEREHELHEKEIGVSKFLVVSGDRETNTQSMSQFADPGDSGGFVATKWGDSLDVVGLIIGGYIKTYRSVKRHYTVCLNLKEAIKELNGVLGETLNMCYLSCINVLVKSPVQTNQYAFDILDRINDLTCLKFHNVNQDEVAAQLKYEREMSCKIDSRTETSLAIFPEDSPFQVCVHNCVKACGYLWSKDPMKAEMCFKKELLAIHKTDKLRLYLLCKAMANVAWYLRTTKQLDPLKQALDRALEFIQEVKHYSLFPSSCEFFIFFEYAHLYKLVSDQENAMKYSLKAIEHSREAYNPSSISSRNRRVLAVSLYAHVMLKCGDHFEYKDAEVSEAAVDDVEHRMGELESIYKKSDPTARSCYLLMNCDLFYRRGQIAGALDMAKRCRSLARKYDLKEDVEGAEHRIRELQKCL